MKQITPPHKSNLLWDAFCIASIVGIWPRFIEPRWIRTKHLQLPISNLPSALQGFKILQFSDLHLNSYVKDSFIAKLISTIHALKPDLIVFTGDFLCYANLSDHTRLHQLLCQIKAPYGCYAILGNHDYAEYVSINEQGNYDVIDNSSTSIYRAFKRLFTSITLTKKITARAQQVANHLPLIELLSTTPFKLLQNDSLAVQVKDSFLNICGCSEYILGRFKPQEAFRNYQPSWPGIVLVHNPDAVPHLKAFPGDVILCGHTHGGQVNLPWMWRKFTLLENMTFKKGLKRQDSKWVYINRGIGSIMPFRWFSPPEITMLTLESKHA